MELVIAFGLGITFGFALERILDAVKAHRTSAVVKRIEPYTLKSPANQGQRDTPPHTESGRHAPSAVLRQPGVGSEGRDAATSGRYSTALVLDTGATLDTGELARADLVMRYYSEQAWVLKDRYGLPGRWVGMIEAEDLLARADIILHRGQAA